MARIVTDRQSELGHWLCSRTGGEYTGGGSYVGLEKDGSLVAVVGYEDYNGASVRMHVAGEGRRWMTRDYLWFCFYYPFEQMKVRKILGLVHSANADAIRLDKHLGFVHEATIADAVPDGDLLILTMTKEQCRFLRKKGYPEFVVDGD